MPLNRNRQVQGHDGVANDEGQEIEAAENQERPANFEICCVPTGCHEGKYINLDTAHDVVKVSCNNEQCEEGEFMHKFCFEQWEETVLTYLRSTGRARSWSEKQRLQNLWTKKGYDLAYKACSCKCTKGHLRKDLNWLPASAVNGVPNVVNDVGKKKKNRKKKNDKPCLGNNSVPAPKQPCTVNPVPNAVVQNIGITTSNNVPMMRLRSSSMSSGGSGSGSPPSIGGWSDFSMSPTHAVVSGKKFFPERKERHNSGSIFSKRQDYSSFNTLPRHKINSYHIKMEDDNVHGNDETRCFILSALSTNKLSRISCILCHSTMIVFDRYPLVDGTFFLSPRQYQVNSIPVKFDGRGQFLNAVCMNCLEGWSISVKCVNCQTIWNGSDLILGTMYSYDIFAAKPCCTDRLKCNNCNEIVRPDRPPEYFSQYSQTVSCSYCGITDCHFVKPLSSFTYAQRI